MMFTKAILKSIFLFILFMKVKGFCEQKIIYKTDLCYSFSEYKGKNCCCNYGQLYKGDKCRKLELTEKINNATDKCSEKIIQILFIKFQIVQIYVIFVKMVFRS